MSSDRLIQFNRFEDPYNVQYKISQYYLEQSLENRTLYIVQNHENQK